MQRTGRRTRTIRGALAAAVLGSVVAVTAPAGAAPVDYGTTGTFALTMGTADEVTSGVAVAGKIDHATADFRAQLNRFSVTFPVVLSDPSGDYPALVEAQVQQWETGYGSFDAAAGTAEWFATLDVGLERWDIPEGPDIVFAPCHFRVDVSMSGTYAPATGRVVLEDPGAVVPPTTDTCGDAGPSVDGVNDAFTGPSAAALTFNLPVVGQVPTLVAADPGRAAAGSNVLLRGTGFVPSTTSVTVGSTVLPDPVLVADDGQLASIFLPPTLPLGPTTITVSTAAGTSAPIGFTVLAASPATGTFDLRPTADLAPSGTAASVLYSDGGFETDLTFSDGTWDAAMPGSPLSSGFIDLSYRLLADGTATGTVDRAAGRATVHAPVTLHVVGAEGVRYTGPYRFAMDLQLTGTFDAATGVVAVAQEPFPLRDLGDRCKVPDLEELCEPGFDPGLFFWGAAIEPEGAATLTFALPEAVDRPTGPTTTSTTTSTSTTTTTTSTTSLPGGLPPVVASLTPVRAAPGAEVVLQGSDLATATEVRFGTVAVTPVVLADPADRAQAGDLIAVVPDLPPGPVDVVVVTPAGVSPAVTLTVLAAVVDPTDPAPTIVPGPTVAPTSGTTPLARTGLAVSRLVTIALVLLVSGALAMTAARRRAGDVVPK